MRPVVIADSDDEDDAGYSSPTTPPDPQRGADGAAGQLDHTNHDTSSTDPAFFQSVFNEQVEAAREQGGRYVGRGDDAPDDLSSFGMVAPTRFNRGVAGPDTSSLSSVTDPRSGKTRKAFDSKYVAGLTQVTTPGRSRQGADGDADPWELPSSPENHAHKARGQRLLGNGKKKSLQDSISSYKDGQSFPQAEARAVTAERDADGEARERSGKRRKVHSSADHLPNSSDMDLIAIPLSNGTRDEQGQHNQVASDALPATLPVGQDSSFLVVPKGLSSSQRKQYKGIAHDGVQQGSSGTATNINTPRSLNPSLPDPTKSSSTGAGASGSSSAKEKNRHILRRRDPSPDEISILEPPYEMKSTRQPGSRLRSHDGPGSDKDGPAEVDISANNAYTAAAGEGDEILDREVATPLPAKKRGRPKKNRLSEAQEAGGSLEAGPEAQPKKRRGRPRKSEMQTNVADITPADADSPRNKPRDPTDLDDEDGATPAKTRSDLVHEAGSSEDGEEASKKGGKIEPVSPAVQNFETDSPAQHHSASESEQQGISRNSKKEGKGGTAVDFKVSAASFSGRPLHRVGLSKRSRIAPLLKLRPK